jgi:SAM-dependent methyltransferase
MMPHPDHEKNRASWNQMVDLHVNHSEYRTQEVLDGGSSLKRIELEALGDVRGKNILHLMCQFGLDTLSWARQGATVTGVDISDRSIEVANELRDKAGLPVDYLRTDVMELIGKLDRKYDFVFQSYGTHIWLADIRKWAEVVAYHLKPGGMFFMIDEHPANVLFLDSPMSYFAKEPERTIDGPDYCERNAVIKGEQVEFQHPVSAIVNALIDAGLTIEQLGEYDFGYYQVEEDWTEMEDHYWLPPEGHTTYPLMLSVKARKPQI